jgi:hypothetical protein
LFGQIDLKTDVVDHIRLFVGSARRTAKNRNDGNKVNEGGSILLVIDYARLTLLISAQVLFQVGNGGLVCKVACLATLDLAIGSLEKTTVSAQNFMLGIACETAEGWGAINDRVVESADINDDEGACEIHRAEDDTRMRAIGNSGENREKIKTRG